MSKRLIAGILIIEMFPLSASLAITAITGEINFDIIIYIHKLVWSFIIFCTSFGLILNYLAEWGGYT